MRQKRLPAMMLEHLHQCAGDSTSDDSDSEYLPDHAEDEFYPASELEVGGQLDMLLRWRKLNLSSCLKKKGELCFSGKNQKILI
ncbi:hypothetical protein T11_15683 [Trichinella zimbabwensis]|uniref:Uncharacterized protein n=1 Tax=Trichinella zimbabwensis TaxID=268475 RepID=A0A0V1HDJ3_9BILA|nr:hypothetical protein T11_15683 [Trichinella zimbabwensis]